MLRRKLSPSQKTMVPILICCILTIFSQTAALARTINVLLVTGDWKSQKWYQETVMGGKELYRGRFIENKVNEVAPGKFTFAELTNYEGQEFIDSNFLSQFDVVLLADVNGWSLSPRVIDALKNFVQQGGGLAYCASYKWSTTLTTACGLDQLLPASLTPPGVKDADWTQWKYLLDETKFLPVLKAPSNPVVAGLNWKHCPTLDKAYRIEPRPNSQILLMTAGGSPILVTGSFGKGRNAISSSIFANDELSTDFGEKWTDIGKFYSQLFSWLGENSKSVKTACKSVDATAQVDIDAAGSSNTISPGLFGFNSAVFPPNLGALSGTALSNFELLNETGSFSRFSPQQFELTANKFDFKALDAHLNESARLKLVPEVVFDDVLWLKWLWNGHNWADPTPQEIDLAANYVSDFLKHVNNGTKADTSYQPNVKYIEFGNEPTINRESIAPFAKMYAAVRARVHKDFPGVQVGTLGGYETPFLEWFLDQSKGQIDFIARHPYGWTPEMLFSEQDRYQAMAKQRGYPPLKFFITECDFWIAGPAKFDYLMKRTFGSVKRDDLIGLLHYRLDQYAEPIYLFGALWANWGPGKGKAGTPMHDAYDSYWVFNHFRGSRIPVSVSTSNNGLKRHIFADASKDKSGALSVVLYYDYGYEGAGYADFRDGNRVDHVNFEVVLKCRPKNHAASVMLGLADGTKITPDVELVSIAAGQSEVHCNVSLKPHTAARLTIN